MTDYLTVTPAGGLMCRQCSATGHVHANPDVPLRQECPTHHVEWVWCGGCGSIWCAGLPNRGQPGHYGEIVGDPSPVTLPAEV